MNSDCRSVIVDYMAQMTETTSPPFPATRTEAFTRLSRFVPLAGPDYARRRNFDLGPQAHTHVSQLSPYLRHRLITEKEVVETVLGRFSQTSAEKFIQEVFWRTYWKGWLEQRPSLWTTYQTDIRSALDRVQTSVGLRNEWESACLGQTGIACFDHWAQELVATGYLHNHARMWFASIWIFTLRLPWALGADFFMRHLLDGDPASNTLSWRWVGGLQTVGKTYLARPENIEKYTQGRFNPVGQLAEFAAPLDGPPIPDRQPIPHGAPPRPGLRTGMLIHEDDMSLGHMLKQCDDVQTTLMLDTHAFSTPLVPAPQLAAFKAEALQDTAQRFGDALGQMAGVAKTKAEVLTWVRDSGLKQIVTPYAPVGPTQALLDQVAAETDLPIVRVMRGYDARCWPYASAGFFKFKKAIPKLIDGFHQPVLL